MNFQSVLVDAGGLDHAAVRGEVAEQDGQAAVDGVGVLDRADAAARARRCPASAHRLVVRERLGGAHAAGRGVEQLERLVGGAAAADVPRRPASSPGRASAPSGRCVCSAPPRWSSPSRAGMPPARCTSSMWYFGLFGATLARQGTRREIASMSATVKSSSASRAAASRCSTVLVEPPIATSSATAFSKASRLAMLRGSTDSSSFS